MALGTVADVVKLDDNNRRLVAQGLRRIRAGRMQPVRIAVAPTVGFSVQVVKGTAVTSIIGFTELTKTGGMLANATFEPFMVYGLVALGYFLLCYPLSLSARYLERRLHASA